MMMAWMMLMITAVSHLYGEPSPSRPAWALDSTPRPRRAPPKGGYHPKRYPADVTRSAAIPNRAFHASSTYPAPRTVRIRSGPILRRR
jgi:hypothetical protein